MHLYGRFSFVLIAGILFVASCTKPVLIGSDFLEDEKASLAYNDIYDLSFFTEKTDSVIVHSDIGSLQLITYLLGNLDDPIFGNTIAEIYAQPMLSDDASRLKDATLDSVVLQLVYDTLGNYGNLQEPVTLEVYKMIENPDFTGEYYSNQRFMSSADLLGSATFIPKPYDSVTVIHIGDTSRIIPSLRIPLSAFKFSDFAFQDSSVYTNLDSFLNFFNGLHIKMTGANNTMIGIDLLNEKSGLFFYYPDQDTGDDRLFQFIFTPAIIKSVYMEHDYSGSFAEPSLTPEPENDYWFVQGMSGLTTKMVINNLDTLGDAIINQAELEVYCTFPNGDVPHYYPPIPYMVTQEDTDSSLTNSLDVKIALSRAEGNILSPAYEVFFGGVLEEVVPGPQAIYKYNMKVTAQVKDIYQAKKENIIYFNPFDKPNFPNRSVMIGPGHPEFAPRLRIYYTAL